MRGALTKQQAIEAMNNNQKVSHTHFSEEEWIKKDCHLYEFEDGCRCNFDEFWSFRDDPSWENGWYIVN